MQTPMVLSIRQAAEKAGIPTYFLRRLVADGRVYATRSGKKIFVSWASLERLLVGDDGEERAAQ